MKRWSLDPFWYMAHPIRTSWTVGSGAMLTPYKLARMQRRRRRRIVVVRVIRRG